MKVFFDTSAFIALYAEGDAWADAARRKSVDLAAQRAVHFTSNAVLYETLNWLSVKIGAAAAQDFAHGAWVESRQLRILPLAREDEWSSVLVLRKFGGLGLSFVDASSIHLVRKHGLDRVFTFDRHFEQAGLSIL